MIVKRLKELTRLVSPLLLLANQTNVVEQVAKKQAPEKNEKNSREGEFRSLKK